MFGLKNIFKIFGKMTLVQQKDYSLTYNNSLLKK